MSREAEWTTTTVDFKKLRTRAQDKQVESMDSFLASEIYILEQGQHPELKSFYDRITGRAELSDEERLIEFKKLLKPLVIIDPSLDQKIESFPIPEELQKKLQTIVNKVRNDETLPVVRFDERYQQIGALSATAALGLSAGKSNEEIKISVEESIRNFQEENSNPQIVLDVPRTPISFYKDGQTYQFPHKARATSEVIRRDLSEFNRTNNLNLTGEQIDYILSSTDQKGSVGAAFMWAQMRNIGSPLDDIKYRDSQIDPTAGEARCHIDIEGSRVKLAVLRGHRGYALDENGYIIAGEAGPVTFKTIQADITELKGDRLLPGLASSPVIPTLLHTSNHTESPYKVESVLSDEAAATAYGIKEICEIKIKSELTETPEERVDLIALRSPDELIPQMISSMAKIKREDPLTLTLNVGLEKGITGKELTSLASKVANAYYTEDQDKEDFIKEVERRDLQKNLNDIIKKEKVGAFTGTLIDTSISTRRVGEIIASYSGENSSRLLEYRRAKYLSDEGNALLIAGYASQHNLPNTKTGEILAEFASAGLSNPLELVIYFAKHKKSESEDLEELLGSFAKSLSFTPEQSKELIIEFAQSKELAPEPLGKLLGSFAKSQSFTPEQSKELIDKFQTSQSLTLEDSKTLITEFIKSRELAPEDSGKLLAHLIKGKSVKESDQLSILSKLYRNEEDQGKLLKGYHHNSGSTNPLTKSNFLWNFSNKMKHTQNEKVNFIASYLSEKTFPEDINYLVPFISEMKKSEKIEFLAEYAEAKAMSYKESAAFTAACSQSADPELKGQQTALLQKVAEKGDCSNGAQLCSAAILLRIGKAKLDLTAASTELVEFVGNVDPARARRYLIKMADKEGVKTNATTMERFGNWFRNIGDKIKGRKTPEAMLFKGDTAQMGKTYTPQRSIDAASASSVSSSSELHASPALTIDVGTPSMGSSRSVSSDSPTLSRAASESSISTAASAKTSQDDSALAARKENIRAAQEKRRAFEEGDKRTSSSLPTPPRPISTGRGRAGSA